MSSAVYVARAEKTSLSDSGCHKKKKRPVSMRQGTKESADTSDGADVDVAESILDDDVEQTSVVPHRRCSRNRLSRKQRRCVNRVRLDTKSVVYQISRTPFQH